MADMKIITGEAWAPIGLRCVGYDASSAGRIRNHTTGRIFTLYAGHKRYAQVCLRVGGRKKTYLVHRLIAFAFLGDPPSGKPYVNHLNGIKTDNRPSNLEWCDPKRNAEHAAGLGLAATGERNGAYTHPERRPRGDRHGSKTRPENCPRGERNGSRLHPERLARGDSNGARLHPERMPRGERHGMTKLTEDDVREIRRRAAAGEKRELIAQTFGLCLSSVGNIIRRDTWAHVK